MKAFTYLAVGLFFSALLYLIISIDTKTYRYKLDLCNQTNLTKECASSVKYYHWVGYLADKLSKQK